VRLRNTTVISDDVVREVVRFTRPPGIGGFDLRVSNLCDSGGPIAGSAYCEGHSYHDRPCPFVVLLVGRRFPCVHKGYDGSRPWLGDRLYLADRTEALVYIAAHELRHLWQKKVPRGRRVWGARGQFSERDADAYALARLRAWRRRGAGSAEEVRS